MPDYNVAETFLSINGEGPRSGQLAFFIRFTGCNLHCSYCDTAWANVPDAPYVPMTGAELLDAARRSGTENITVTGGEPLLQPGIRDLLALLCGDPQFYVEVETNGSFPLRPYQDLSPRLSFTMDYKLPGSGMESCMCPENLTLLTRNDTVKFVCGSREDLFRALQVMETCSLVQRTRVSLSPVFGKLEPREIVEFMKEHRLTGVNLQLQIHKFIWDPERRGV